MNRDKSNFKIREDGLGWVETPMKIVGKVRHLDPKAALVWNASLCKLLPDWARKRPRGVFRFRTWEAANQWDMKVKKTAKHAG